MPPQHEKNDLMPYSDMGISAEELLEQIFTKTQELYKELCHNENDASSNHYEIFKLLTDLGRTLINADRASFWKWNKRAHEIRTTAAVGTGRIKARALWEKQFPKKKL